jgi:hypothetical protein
MSTGSAERPVAKPRGTAHRVWVIIFRVVATLAGLFFVVAVVLMASAPWVLLQPDQDVRTELNRWFLTVAGSVDAITAGVLLALALQPRRTLLVVELAGAVIVAGGIILPFQPSFAAILAVGVVPLLAYPYWRDLRIFPSWWTGVSRSVLILAVLAGAGLIVTAAIAFPRQIGRQMKRLVAAGGWTMPSTRPCLRWPERSPLAADPAAGSSEGYAARSGCTWGWSPHWFFRTTPAHGVASAARLHFWSASASALPPGAAPNMKGLALHAVPCHSCARSNRKIRVVDAFLGMRQIWS